MSLSRRVGWNAAWQLTGRVYTASLAFVIISLLLPRQLEPAEFGVFAFYLTLYQLLAGMLDFGAGTIVVREASKDRGAAGRLIGMLIGLKARFAILGVIVLVSVAWVFEGPGARFAVLCAAAGHLAFHAPAGAAAIFHVDMDFRRTVVALAVGQTAWLLGTLALLLAGSVDPALYLLAYGLFPLVNGVLVYVWARGVVHIRHDAPLEERRKLWRAAWPAGVSMAMASVYFSIDAAMLRPLLGEVAVAHYSAAYRLMAVALMVPVLFSQVIFPVFARLWGQGAAALDPFFQRCAVVLLSAGLIFPVTVPQVARDLMGVVYPAEFGPGAPSLAILSAAILLVFGAYPHVMALLAAGHQRRMMVISIGGAVLNVGLNLWWVPVLGIAGAAWTTVLTEAFVLVAAAVSVRQLTGLRLRLGALRRAALCAAGAAGVLAWGLPAVASAGGRTTLGLGVGLVALLLCGILPLDLGSDAALGAAGADDGDTAGDGHGADDDERTSR